MNTAQRDPNTGEYTDESGGRYRLTDTGQRIPAAQADYTVDPASGWRDYDTSQGHCGLCGRLGCNGGCFK